MVTESHLDDDDDDDVILIDKIKNTSEWNELILKKTKKIFKKIKGLRTIIVNIKI